MTLLKVGHTFICVARVTLVVALPLILTSLRIISSQILHFLPAWLQPHTLWAGIINVTLVRGNLNLYMITSIRAQQLHSKSNGVFQGDEINFQTQAFFSGQGIYIKT